MSIATRFRSLWRGVRRDRELEAEMADEFRAHMELRAEDLVRTGLSHEAALRQARIEFGSVPRYRDEAREARGLQWLDDLRFSWLDFKLGFRMLVRYPGLTVMGVVAMAMGIAFGAGFFEFGSQWAAPNLPFDGGDRLVGIEVRDQETGSLDRRSLHDFEVWREDLRSIEELGAFRMVSRNLVTPDGPQGPVLSTEISASAFRLVGTPPLHGRFLTEQDEAPGVPPVAVLGFELWRTSFGEAPEVVGQSIRLGAEEATVVGVMPEGFEFPHSQRLWTPLRLDPADYALGEGPGISVFGRLSSGSTLEEARAELSSRPVQAEIAQPSAGPRLHASVVPFTELVFIPVQGFFNPEFVGANLFILALVVLLSANVALLVFARTATRESELAVRSALGASRNRIVIQLFSEALVLGGIGAAVGLWGARRGYRWFLSAIEAAEGPLPFWFVPEISPTTVAYAVILTLVASAVAGILPALKVTRGTAALKAASAGGGGLRFGGVWTLVIVAQVAVTVPLPAFSYFVLDQMVGVSQLEAEIDPREYVTTQLEMERALDSVDPRASEWSPGRPDTGTTPSGGPFLERYVQTLDELERRLLAEADVRSVAFMDRPPLANRPYRQVEMDDGAVPPPDTRGHRVGAASVEPDYFEALGVSVVDGRAFLVEEADARAPVAIVDEPFVDRVLGGRNPIGRRLRYVAIEGSPSPGADTPWYEIVGVVPDLGIEEGDVRGGVYHPVARGSMYPMSMVVRLGSDARAFSSRLHSIAADVDPTLRLEGLRPLEDIASGEVGVYAWAVSAVFLFTGTALMLSLAGIYAVMSFTVSRRTREIGIRIALGARPRSLLLATFRRPLTQIALGVLAGAYLLDLVSSWILGNLALPQLLLVALAAIGMAGVCLLACIGPIRRALRVQPIEALRVEG